MNRRLPVALAALGLAQVLCVQSAAPAAAAAPSRFESSIWVPFWLPGAVHEVRANAGVFRTASLFWYETASCSSIRREPGAGSRRDVRALRAKGLHVLATVVGSGLPPRAAIRCFSNPATRRAHVHRLVRLAVDGHYDGIDIDYETLAHTKSSTRALQVRHAFDRFVTDLCPALRAHGKQCAVTVMPRVDDSTRVVLGKVIPGVYDYAAIAAAADRMRVMAYDEHSGRFGPGPVAGFPWVRRVIAYTASKTPLSKVELGIPLYGRDFSRHDSVAVSSSEAMTLARQHRVRPHFDTAQREETFRYRSHGVRHTVWFSSPRAVAARTRLAVSDGMGGAAYWAATLDLPGTWKAVRRAAR
ncbi:MAG TPA: glycosyl hydrolase family 18 protein [Mycobacteriales bacterium]|nr:glycosyl hydrolase family 18 protein [Mycobacteriales bacterium]